MHNPLKTTPLGLRAALWALCILAAGGLTFSQGCDGDGDDKPDGAVDAGDVGGDGDASGDCPAPEAVTDLLPESLACVGLYTDVAKQTVAPGVRSFAPAYKLWSDGAQKARWILMPEGTAIDGTDPDDWKFPPLTRLFKEFSWKGHRVETRVFWKVSQGRWLKAAYHWNADETAATRFDGGEVDVAGDTYEIPSGKMCDQCHKGRTDRALGFEPVLLGLPGAEGITLKSLVDDGLLDNYSGPTELSIGDDGTGVGAEVLPWLHVNCGVSCHNDFPASEAAKTDMRMRLRAEELDGSATGGLDTRTTNIDMAASTRRWADWTRIVAGNPDESLLYFLVTTRDDANDKDRMPPIGSRIVPTDAAAMLDTWIRAMVPTPPDGDLDGGTPDADAGI